MDHDRIAQDFFDRYRSALLARDADAVAELYAVPGLIAFPQQSIAVTDAQQTRDFFAASWGQYEGVCDVTADVTVTASAGHSVWADVTWRYDTGGTERMMYQLIDTGADWRIAVLTPLS